MSRKAATPSETAESSADLHSAEIIPLPVNALPRELTAGDLFPSPLNPRRIGAGAEADLELEDSIVAKGLLEPLLARPSLRGPAKFEIIFGKRRHAAIVSAIGKGRLPADLIIPTTVREASDEELIVLAGIENLERADMHPLDEATLFESLRPFIKARDPKLDVGAEIARRFHVSRRKVFDRLKLLRLAPKARDALVAGKLPLQYALALAVGEPAAQAEELSDILERIECGWALDPDDIRENMKGSRARVDVAAFDVALYTGEILEEDGESYFADMKQFRKLQAKALEVEIAAQALKWPWARGLKKGESVHEFRETKKSDAEAGALVFLDDDDRLQVRAPVLDPAVAAKREKAGQRAGRAVSEHQSPRAASRAPSEKRCLTDSQSVFVKAAKTRAMRHAVANSPDVALAVAIVALLGEDDGEIWIRDDHNHGNENTVEPDDAFKALRAERLKPIAALAKSSATSSKHRAEVLRAVLKLDRREQVEIFALLVAERVGTRWGYDTRVGDSPLAIAIAEASGAEKYLPALWAPDEKYFAAHARGYLEELAARGDLVPPFTGVKKGQLVKEILACPAGTWIPDHFIETLFLGDAEMKQTFAICARRCREPAKAAKKPKAKAKPKIARGARIKKAV